MDNMITYCPALKKRAAHTLDPPSSPSEEEQTPPPLLRRGIVTITTLEM